MTQREDNSSTAAGNIKTKTPKGYLCRKPEPMLQVNYLRQNKEEVLRRLAIKHFKQPQVVEEVIALDDERKRLQLEFDTTQAKVNTAS